MMPISSGFLLKKTPLFFSPGGGNFANLKPQLLKAHERPLPKLIFGIKRNTKPIKGIMVFSEESTLLA